MVAKGVVLCEGPEITKPLKMDVSRTEEAFGPFLDYESMVRSVVEEYLSFHDEA
jgi:hypothetical protein